jgi:hypothetical protein
MPKLAMATSADHPQLYADDLPLVAALASLGIESYAAVWDSPGAKWNDPLIIRSVWDYHHRPAKFLKWIQDTGAHVPVFNDPSLVVWNSHKTYLRDLGARGVAVVPTLWADARSPLDLAAAFKERGWREVVIKPAVSASAHGAKRFTRERIAEAQAHLDRLAALGTAMVQPYLASVEDYGERSFIFIEGKYTHAVRRQAVLSQPFEMENPAPRVEPTDAESALCRATLAALPIAPLYARIDVAPDAAGTPRLMEAELIEPRLYFREAPAAAGALAAALATRLG